MSSYGRTLPEPCIFAFTIDLVQRENERRSPSNPRKLLVHVQTVDWLWCLLRCMSLFMVHFGNAGPASRFQFIEVKRTSRLGTQVVKIKPNCCISILRRLHWKAALEALTLSGPKSPRRRALVMQS